VDLRAKALEADFRAAEGGAQTEVPRSLGWLIAAQSSTRQEKFNDYESGPLGRARRIFARKSPRLHPNLEKCVDVTEFFAGQWSELRGAPVRPKSG
jgi:hypothetical protein